MKENCDLSHEKVSIFRWLMAELHLGKWLIPGCKNTVVCSLSFTSFKCSLTPLSGFILHLQAHTHTHTVILVLTQKGSTVIMWRVATLQVVDKHKLVSHVELIEPKEDAAWPVYSRDRKRLIKASDDLWSLYPYSNYLCLTFP